MKVQYIGNSDYPPTTTECFGYTFELNGPAVEVKGEAMKLAHNKTFRVVDGEPVKWVGGVTSDGKAVLPDDIAADVRFQSVSGMREATQDDRDVAVRAALEAAGVKVDGRWGSARLQAELEALNGSHGR